MPNPLGMGNAVGGNTDMQRAIWFIALFVLAYSSKLSLSESKLLLSESPDKLQQIVDPIVAGCCIANPGATCCKREDKELAQIQASTTISSFESAEPYISEMQDDIEVLEPKVCQIGKTPITDVTEVRVYSSSSHGKRCSEAANRYRNQLKNQVVDWADAYSLAIDYFSSCLRTGPLEPTQDAFAQLNSSYENQVGFITREGKAPHCMGVRVGNKILTAKHCFQLTVVGEEMLLSQDISKYEFTTLDGTLKTRLNSPVTDGSASKLSFSKLQEDWIVFQTAMPLAESGKKESISLGRVVN